jgi:hypothetical protein
MSNLITGHSAAKTILRYQTLAAKRHMGDCQREDGTGSRKS